MRFRYLGTRYPVLPGTRYPVPGTRYPAPGTRHPALLKIRDTYGPLLLLVSIFARSQSAMRLAFKRERDVSSDSALHGLEGMQPFISVFDAAVDRLRPLLLQGARHVRPTGTATSYTSAFSQPRRAGCPPGFDMTRAIRDDKEAFFAAAKKLVHPLARVEIVLPPDLRAAVDTVCDQRDRIGQWREARLDIIRHVATSLEPMSAEIMRTTAHDAPHVLRAVGPRAHPALAAAIADAIGHPDKAFVRSHFVTGHELIGSMKDTGLWRLKDPLELHRHRQEAVPVTDFLATNARTARQLQKSLQGQWAAASRPGAPPKSMLAIKAAWDASNLQVKKGTSLGPYSVSHTVKRYGYGCYRANHRFAIWQGTKWRPCDNFRKSKANATTVTVERLTLLRPTFSADIGRAFAREAEQRAWHFPWQMGAGGDDEPDAYCSSPARQPQFAVAYVVNPNTGIVHAFYPRGLPFGAALAVPEYSRKPAFVVAAARSLLAAIVGGYIDDSATPEPDFALGREDLSQPINSGLRFPGSSQGVYWALYSLLGFALAPEKHLPWSMVPTFVGVVTDFTQMTSHGIIRLRIKDTTRLKIKASIETIFEENDLSPAKSASLVGQAQYIMCLGSVGRAQLQPLRARSHELTSPAPDSESGEHWPIRSTPGLFDSLTFFSNVLAEKGGLPDAILRTRHSEAASPIVLSDAMWRPDPRLEFGYGRVAYLAWIPLRTGGVRFAYAEVVIPQHILGFFHELRAKKSFICVLEELGIAAPYFSKELAPAFRDTHVIHFADNVAANTSVIKGGSSAPDMARIVAALHIRLVKESISLWIEFVKSEANLADLPSRGQFDLIHAMGAQRVPFQIPPFRGWSGEV